MAKTTEIENSRFAVDLSLIKRRTTERNEVVNSERARRYAPICAYSGIKEGRQISVSAFFARWNICCLWGTTSFNTKCVSFGKQWAVPLWLIASF